MVCSGVVVVSRIVHEVIMAMTKELHANIRCAQCPHIVSLQTLDLHAFLHNQMKWLMGMDRRIPRHVVDSRGLWFLCTRAVQYELKFLSIGLSLWVFGLGRVDGPTDEWPASQRC